MSNINNRVFDAMANSTDSKELFADDSMQTLAQAIYTNIDGTNSQGKLRDLLESYDLGLLKPKISSSPKSRNPKGNINLISFINSMKDQPWYGEFRAYQKDLWNQNENDQMTTSVAYQKEQLWLVDRLITEIKQSGQKLEDFGFSPKHVDWGPESPDQYEAPRYVKGNYYIENPSNTTVQDLLNITKDSILRRYEKRDPINNKFERDVGLDIMNEVMNKHGLDPVSDYK